MDRSAKTGSGAPKVFSVIALVISAIAIIFALLLLIISKVGSGQGGTATAITNSVAVSVAGMILFTAFTWMFAIMGELIGLIMLIIDIVVKRSGILWMPISAIVLGVISMLLSIFAY